MTLLELFALLKKHLKLVIALPIACALATAVFSWAFLPNTYTSTVSMYVLTRANENTSVLTSTDLTASQMLTNDVATLIKSDRIESDTASKLQMDSLKGYDVKVSSETTTRVITVSVTGKSAQTTAIVANGLAETADEASAPSGPNRIMYTAVGFLAGLFIAIAAVVLMDMTNTRVRNADELEELLPVPVIGRIPVIK